jgi:hypothetical protein
MSQRDPSKQRVDSGRPLLGRVSPATLALVEAAEAEYGVPFLKVLEKLASLGYCKVHAGDLLGFTEGQFLAMLRRIDPGIDWPKYDHAAYLETHPTATDTPAHRAASLRNLEKAQAASDRYWKEKYPEVYDYQSTYWQQVREHRSQGKTYRQIAYLMGIPMGTFEKRMRAHRAAWQPLDKQSPKGQNGATHKEGHPNEHHA